MTATATAGLRSLYNRITPACPTDEADAAVAGVTNVEGFFDPTHPVPLLGTRYQYVKKIGRGTFAVIIMATDMFDPERRLVAIKVMHAQYIEIGMQEARRIRNINAKDVHDVAHIVRCFNCFTCGRHYCIVFELMSMSPIRHCIDHATTSVGGSGGSRARSAVQRRTNAVRKVAAQLMAALSLLRRAAVIHADIKPENILLRDNDATNCSIKLADFGNAMQATEEETSAYYGTFELQSLWYRAPEVGPEHPRASVALLALLALSWTDHERRRDTNKHEVVHRVGIYLQLCDFGPTVWSCDRRVVGGLCARRAVPRGAHVRGKRQRRCVGPDSGHPRPPPTQTICTRCAC
eukprot:m.177888 g.177888  ORF g.177888 m.177888 type:complete len:349 (+) comp24503_c0_seq2:47-1093(+)